jgi:aspartate/glutamate racemase
MSCDSSGEYDRLINQQMGWRLGGRHNAKSVMVTVEFAQIEELQREVLWETLQHVPLEGAQIQDTLGDVREQLGVRQDRTARLEQALAAYNEGLA